MDTDVKMSAHFYVSYGKRYHGYLRVISKNKDLTFKFKNGEVNKKMMNTNFSCSQCSKTWQKSGTTNCWSNDPETMPPKPGNCPSKDHMEVIQECFELYKGDSDDARMAQVAAKVEGLCYQPVPGSQTLNARWTRVEDTIAFAKLMGYEKLALRPVSVCSMRPTYWQ